MRIEINEKREILITSILPNVKIGSLNSELTDEAVRELELRLKLAEQFKQMMHSVEPMIGTIVSDLESLVHVLSKMSVLSNQYKPGSTDF